VKQSLDTIYRQQPEVLGTEFVRSPKREAVTVEQRPGPDWSSVRAIASRLLERSDQLADELLHDAVPGLDASLAPEDARAHARWLIRAFLSGVSERRPPTTEQIARCEAFGALRATQGIDASAVVQGYHHAHRELWQRVVEEVADEPGVDPTLLAATFVQGLQWLDATVEAISRGFHVQAGESRSARERASHQLVTLLESAETSSDRVRSLAAGLGFDPDGAFFAVHGHRAARPHDPAGSADTQLAQSDDFRTVLGQPQPGERWGIGAKRPGLLGARRSIIDAKLAYAALPEEGGRLDFAQSWCLCLPQAHREAIDPLLDTAREVARSRPYLLAAVVAFAEARFAVSPAARALVVHPNTLSYRLDQWRRLTGLDPRTVTGLVHSLYLAR
jgi:hypothetical protein